MPENIEIKVVVDSSEATEGLDNVSKGLEKTSKKAGDSKANLNTFNNSLGKISPTAGRVTSTVTQMGRTMTTIANPNGAFGKACTSIGESIGNITSSKAFGRVGAVAGIAALGTQLMQTFNGAGAKLAGFDKMYVLGATSWLDGLDDLKLKFEELGKVVTELVGSVGLLFPMIEALISQWATDNPWATAVPDAIAVAVTQTQKWIEDWKVKVQQNWQIFVDCASLAWEMATKPMVDYFNKFQALAGAVWGAFTSYASNAWGDVVKMGQSAADAVGSAFQSVFSSAWNTVNSIIASLRSAMGGGGSGGSSSSSSSSSSSGGGGSSSSGVKSTDDVSKYGPQLGGSKLLKDLSTIAPAFDVAGIVKDLADKTGVSKAVSDAVNGGLNALSGALSSVNDALSGGYKMIDKSTGKESGVLGDTSKEGITSSLGVLTSLVGGGSAAKAASSVASKVGSAIGNASKNVGKWADDVGKSVSCALNSLKKTLGFANGGVFEPNSPIIGILGDNTHEREIASPISTMKQAFKEALNEMGGASGGKVTADITLNVDGRKLARVLFDDLQAEGTRRGTGFV